MTPHAGSFEAAGMADPTKTTTTDERVPDDHVVVLFGGTGDLARRKLLPGLFHLEQAGMLPRRYRIIATSRGSMTDEAVRELAKGAVEQFGRLGSDASWQTFAAKLSFASQETLVDAVADAEAELGGRARRLFYLSVPPVASAGIVSMLNAAGLAENARVILEKPFGTDLASARALNYNVHAAFDETRVFRIDHFLGKEAVQNILALRFANGIFEPIWNRDHIDHVQIDVPETLSIGTRAAFYEQTGAYRDMIVTHLLQVLGFIAMEPPTSFSAKALLDETVKVAESLRPIDRGEVVYGQYAGYRDERGVAADSETETFVAASLSTTGAGPACRSTCAPASGWPTRGASSRSPSATRRVACSSRPTASDRTSSSSNSATWAGSRPASSPRSPAPRCSWDRRDPPSTTTVRSPTRTSSGPTSA
jgi:glucose-6-phosphate 1-dehydrogenase